MESLPQRVSCGACGHGKAMDTYDAFAVHVTVAALQKKVGGYGSARPKCLVTMIKSEPSMDPSLVTSQFAFHLSGGGAPSQEPKHQATTIMSEPLTVPSGTKASESYPGAPVKSPVIETRIQPTLELLSAIRLSRNGVNTSNQRVIALHAHVPGLCLLR
jgi:hypothetical protein